MTTQPTSGKPTGNAAGQAKRPAPHANADDAEHKMSAKDLTGCLTIAAIGVVATVVIIGVTVFICYLFE